MGGRLWSACTNPVDIKRKNALIREFTDNIELLFDENDVSILCSSCVISIH